jgi:pyruvate dehydrogenase E1 component alpha subunit
MPDPAPTAMFDSVYAEQTPWLAAQRAEFVEYHASFEDDGHGRPEEETPGPGEDVF